MSLKTLILASLIALLSVALVGRADAQPAGKQEVKIGEVRDAKDVRPAPGQPAPAEPAKPAKPKDRD